jgi:hypothetical protein
MVHKRTRKQASKQGSRRDGEWKGEEWFEDYLDVMWLIAAGRVRHWMSVDGCFVRHMRPLDGIIPSTRELDLMTPD